MRPACGFRFAVPLAAAGLLLGHAAFAEPPAALDAVVVTATRGARAALDVPAAVERIEAERVRDAQWRVNVSEALAGVPGLVALNRNNFAQDLQISVRGFGARASFGVRGVRLIVDGVPATFPDGQGQVSHWPLGAAESIEVLRGPLSSLYGNSSGGVIALRTQLPAQAPPAQAGVAIGPDGTRRASVGLAGATVALDLARFETDGPRPHSSARRDTALLRAAWSTGSTEVRVGLNALAMPGAQDPLGLTRAQFDADPRQAAPDAERFNTRKTTRQTLLGAELRSPLREALDLQAAAWLGTRAVEQYQAIPVATQLNPLHPGGVVDFSREFGGVDLRLRRSTAGSTWTLGVSAERLDEDRRGYENYAGSPSEPQLGVRGRLRRDEANRVESLDAYAQIEHHLDPLWRLHAGMRAGRVAFTSGDRYREGPNGDDSGARAYTAVTPTVGLWRRAGDGSIYLAYGRGFETPTLNELAYRADGSAGFNAELRAARSDHLELGAKAQGRTGQASLALFAVRTRDDIVVRTNVGGRASFANAEGTDRRGLEVALRWHPEALRGGEWLFAAAAIRAQFSRDFLTCTGVPCAAATLRVPAGTALPAVPARTASLRLRQPLGGLEIVGDWQARSALTVNDRASDRAPGAAVVNFSVAGDLRAGRWAGRWFVRVDNAAGRVYAGSVIVNEGSGRFFEPAAGRSWVIGVDLRPF